MKKVTQVLQDIFQDVPRPSKTQFWSFVTAAILMTIGVICSQPKPVAAKQQVAPPPTVDPIALVSPVKTGVPDALERQLEKNPSLAAKDDRFRYTGDLNNKTAVMKWAKLTAKALAIQTGYEDWQFGAHVTASASGKLYCVIQQDSIGKLQVVEFMPVIVPPPPPQYTQVAVRKAAPSVGAASFLGNEEKKLPSYERSILY